MRNKRTARERKVLKTRLVHLAPSGLNNVRNKTRRGTLLLAQSHIFVMYAIEMVSTCIARADGNVSENCRTNKQETTSGHIKRPAETLSGKRF